MSIFVAKFLSLHQHRDLRPKPSERKFYPLFKNVKKEAKAHFMMAQIEKEVGGA
jgi:hypothetical protein